MPKNWLDRPPRNLPTRPDTKTSVSKQVDRTELERRYGSPTAILVLDTSGSMQNAGKLQLAKDGVLEFGGKAVSLGYEVGLVSFANEPTLVREATTDLDRLGESCRPLQADGGTELQPALRCAAEALPRRGPRYLIVATDGHTNNKEGAVAVAEELKANGVRIITIGTPDADADLLARIASERDLSSVVPDAEFGNQIARSADRLALPPSRDE